jgi:pyruvate dehydrogenase E2 component (dihydrolipoamide acetyltransferase)
MQGFSRPWLALDAHEATIGASLYDPERRMANLKEARVPDIGGYDDVPVIEVLVKVGDAVEQDQGLVTLESDKATMEVPAPFAGTVRELKVEVGGTLSEGDVVAMIEPAGEGDADGASGSKDEGGGAKPRKQDKDTSGKAEAKPDKAAEPKREDAKAKQDAKPAAERQDSDDAHEVGEASDHLQRAPVDKADAPMGAGLPPVRFEAGALMPGKVPYASPAVRLIARELGVDLMQVEGSERGGRISREDVQKFVKRAMQDGGGAKAPGGQGLALLPWPKVDFSKFGEVETRPLSRIQKISGANLARNWAMIPHVTQFDDADITELEALRVALNKENEGRDGKRTGPKLTMLAFLMKASVAALQQFPQFNASLDASGEELTLKKYFHIGFAADTPNGLVVPVVRDCDRKGVNEIAEETSALAKKARDGKLGPAEMQGGCFSISSLGGIGGTAFTPIVNAPEVAILGVSKAAMQPVWNGEAFEPRLVLPLSLSYDHRVIDGAAAARFTAHLAQLLGDMRRVLL